MVYIFICIAFVDFKRRLILRGEEVFTKKVVGSGITGKCFRVILKMYMYSMVINHVYVLIMRNLTISCVTPE